MIQSENFWITLYFAGCVFGRRMNGHTKLTYTAEFSFVAMQLLVVVNL